MARMTTTRITERAPIDTSQSSNPQLSPTANMAAGAAAGSTMFAVADALNQATSVLGDKAAFAAHKQAQADKEAGQTAMLRAYADSGIGGVDAMGQNLEQSETSAAFKKGAMETRGMLAAQEWGLKVSEQASKLDPNDAAGFQELLKASKAELLQSNDPTFQRTFGPAIARQEIAAREAFQKRADAENQKEAIANGGQLVQNAITDGSIFQEGGLAKLRDYVQGATKLPRSLVSEQILLPAAMQALSSGQTAPDKLMGVLRQKWPDGTPGLASVYGLDLERAAKEGARIIKADAAEKQAKAETAWAFNADDMARRGQLTRAYIRQKEAEFGHADDPNWSLAWMHRQEQYLKEAAAKRKQATDSDMDLAALANPAKYANYLATRGDKVQTSLDSAWSKLAFAADSGNADAQKALPGVVRLAVQNGYTITPLKNQIDRADLSDPSQVAATYRTVQQFRDHAGPDDKQNVDRALNRTMGPDAAAKVARIDYLRNTMHLNDAQAFAAVTSNPLPKADAEKAVGMAWNKASKSIDKTDNQLAYNAQVRDVAIQAMQSGAYAKAEDAIAFATTYVKDNTIEFQGRRYNNAGFTNGAGPAMEAISADYETKMRKAGDIGPDEKIVWVPDEKTNGKQWFAYRPEKGAFAVHDGVRVSVAPGAAGQQYDAWKAAEAATNTVSAMGAASGSGVEGVNVSAARLAGMDSTQIAAVAAQAKAKQAVIDSTPLPTDRKAVLQYAKAIGVSRSVRENQLLNLYHSGASLEDLVKTAKQYAPMPKGEAAQAALGRSFIDWLHRDKQPTNP